MFSPPFMAVILGLLMATIDTSMLSLVKTINLGTINMSWMIIPTIIYAIQPWIFLRSLNYQSLTIMNLTWDILSDLLVTLVGIFIFNDYLSFNKKLGIITTFLTLFLFSH